MRAYSLLVPFCKKTSHTAAKKSSHNRQLERDVIQQFRTSDSPARKALSRLQKMRAASPETTHDLLRRTNLKHLQKLRAEPKKGKTLLPHAREKKKMKELAVVFMSLAPASEYTRAARATKRNGGDLSSVIRAYCARLLLQHVHAYKPTHVDLLPRPRRYT